MMEFLRWRQVISTPYTNRSYHPRPKATATKWCNLETITRPSREKLSQPRRVNVGPPPKAKPRTWLATLRAKELDATASRQVPTKPARVSADHSPNSSLSPEKKYCAICIPLGKLCSNKFAGSQERDDSKEEEGNDQGKGEDNFFVCSNWDTDLEEQDWKKNKK